MFSEINTSQQRAAHGAHRIDGVEMQLEFIRKPLITNREIERNENKNKNLHIFLRRIKRIHE